MATAALWQLLRTQIDEELAAAVAASGSDDGGGEHKRQRRAEPVAADAPSPET